MLKQSELKRSCDRVSPDVLLRFVGAERSETGNQREYLVPTYLSPWYAEVKGPWRRWWHVIRDALRIRL